MNFEQLREVIKNIKTRLTCTSCESNFGNKDIYVVSSIADKCLLLINCKECGTPIMVTASINTGSVDISENSHSFKTEEGECDFISSDDVLEIHSFLKEFDGDFNNVINQHIGK